MINNFMIDIHVMFMIFKILLHGMDSDVPLNLAIRVVHVWCPSRSLDCMCFIGHMIVLGTFSRDPNEKLTNT